MVMWIYGNEALKVTVLAVAINMMHMIPHRNLAVVFDVSDTSFLMNFS